MNNPATEVDFDIMRAVLAGKASLLEPSIDEINNELEELKLRPRFNKRKPAKQVRMTITISPEMRRDAARREHELQRQLELTGRDEL